MCCVARVCVHVCVNGVSSVDRREIMTQALIILCLDVLTGAQARCQRAGLVSFITENQTPTDKNKQKGKKKKRGRRRG